MKKLFVILSLGAILVSNSFGVVLTWSSDGEDAYDALDWRAWYSRSRFQENENGVSDYYNKKIGLVALKNTTRVLNAFSNFNIRKVIGKSKSGRRVKVSTIGIESCQCVAFIKEMTGNSSSTQDWIEGNSLNSNNLSDLEVGTVIATFDINGNYNYGHTAIVVEKSGKGDYIEVIDQNWNPILDKDFADREIDLGVENPNCEWNTNQNEKGFVMKHRLYFNGHNGINNANNYSIVEIY